MNRSISRNLLLSVVCFAMLTSAMISSFGRSPSAHAADASGWGTRPMLIDVSNPTDPEHFVVTGEHFTPGGKVYVALYDQAGKQLYERRWVTASFDAGLGGTIHETFAGLCGAAAMMRAEDASTQRWTGWLTVQLNCSTTNPAGVANDLNVSLQLPVATTPVPAYAIANDVNGAAVTATNPLQLFNATGASASGDVVVSGLGFTAGDQVYIAVYDPMGARLYPSLWTRATHDVKITGASDQSPEAHPIVSESADGRFSATFAGLCGENVMIRAYDAGTKSWSNWLDIARC